MQLTLKIEMEFKQAKVQILAGLGDNVGNFTREFADFLWKCTVLEIYWL